jgi:hypothetical protein
MKKITQSQIKRYKKLSKQYSINNSLQADDYKFYVQSDISERIAYALLCLDRTATIKEIQSYANDKNNFSDII